MSEVSVLSHEYRTAANLSHVLNQSVVALKKGRLGLPDAETTPPEELKMRRHHVAQVVDAVLDRLAPPAEVSRPAAERAPPVPEALIARLRADHLGDMTYYLEDLERAAKHLRGGVHALTEADLCRLDELAVAADTEASRIFRRLLRA